MVDRSALYPGAVVTVRMRIVEPHDHRGFYWGHGEAGGMFISPEDILSVEPRPLAVGDRVRRVLPCGEGVGKIIHIHNGAAWVGYDELSWLEPLSDLTRIPEERAP